MSNRTSIILVVVLTFLAAYFIVTFVEFYDEEQDLGWGSAAQRNPFLAAQMFSEKQGATVASENGYMKLGDIYSYDTLLFASTSEILSEKRLLELVDWMKSGGHLIIGAYNAADTKNDRLLKYFGLSAYKTEYKPSFPSGDVFGDLNENSNKNEKLDKNTEESEKEKRKKFVERLKNYNETLKKQGVVAPSKSLEETPRNKIDAYEAEVDRSRLTTLNFNNDPDQWVIEFDASVALDHPAFNDAAFNDDNNLAYTYKPSYWSGSKYGEHFTQFNVGSGLLTVVSDTGIFETNNIGKFDHAYLWQALAGKTAIGILFGSDMPSLWYMLRAFMPEVLIALLVFIVMWIWFNVRRFGPVREVSIKVRRSSSEHIAASAQYQWRGGWQQDLLAPVREEITRLAENRLTGYDVADKMKKIDILALACEMPREAVYQAMTRETQLNEDAFQNLVKTLQRIRDGL